ncbi:hypothetical protein F511_30282 [Dorcoceras hygrometricum]|uniref:Uncharacterized protein n=1 Tax=Dorcoceras hygrometricum TaxID=472368 RepID=A0A2Z7C142_9LAMI|nr:hypothetical protein F511_30282 [Dorcoceras hygrometricum]
MRRVVNYHSSWARQRQVELFDASGIQGTQVLQLVVVLTQLVVPQEITRPDSNTVLLISLLISLLAAMTRVDSYHALMSFGNSRLSDLV